MRESTWYPRLAVDGDGSGLVSQAGTLLLVRTAEKIGLVKGLSQALSPWRKPLSTHNPGKIVLDLAIAVAAGGDCAADVSLLRTQPGVFGSVASDPTVSRLVSALAEDVPKALSAIASARAAARAVVWKRAGRSAPDHGIDADNPLIIDLERRPCSTRTATRRRPPRPGRKDSGSIRCARSSTTVPTAPASQRRSCCGPGTPAAIPRSTTSRCAARSPHPAAMAANVAGRAESIGAH